MTTSDRSDRSDQSDASDSSAPAARLGLILPHGGYRRLRSFQAAEVAYDGTVIFCDRFIDRRSRTHDQMVQAARGGVQNIAEGSLAAATSKRAELKLTGVARASLGELLRDGEDFLRQHGLRQWAKDSTEALAVRRKYQAEAAEPSDRSDGPGNPGPPDPYGLRTATAGVAANTLICLTNQAMYLHGRQLGRLEQDFLQHGGVTERMHALRTAERERQQAAERSAASDQSDTSDTSDRSGAAAPVCPRCGKPMAQRTARKGPRAGQPFWGCSGYPECTGTRPLAAAAAAAASDRSDRSDAAARAACPPAPPPRPAHGGPP